MAVLLVDYENVHAQNGLDGVNYLNCNDSLYIFYSISCEKIRADYMEHINNSDCVFKIVRLVKSGKNALDFYIATKVGELIAAGKSQIIIISRDQGFSSIIDYVSSVHGDALQIVQASTIEKGLVLLQDPDDIDRRRIIHSKLNTLNLASEQAKYEEVQKIRHMIKSAFTGTKHEENVDNIVDFVKNEIGKPQKVLYSDTLHTYGIKKGLDIYRILKVVI